jgi:hypothetical protein
MNKKLNRSVVMMGDKIYKVEDNNVIINWRQLNESRILTTTELNILYALLDKVEANQGRKIAYV